MKKGVGGEGEEKTPGIHAIFSQVKIISCLAPFDR